MRLHTDFLDYYDHHFSNKGIEFERMSTSGLSRSDMFEFLIKHGYEVPKYGPASRLYNPLFPYRKIVVYTDEKAHRGEGKVLTSLMEGLRMYPNCLASYYIPSSSPISYRHLQIGKHQFRLIYHSLTDSWRSNVGEVEVKIIEQRIEDHPTIKEPLFAIDFVKEDDKYYAIDYNVAPQIKGTGIEEILSPSEVVSALIEPFSKANGW